MEDFSMNPHKDCINKLQDLIGCACIGDCLTEGRGTLLEKKNKKDEKIAKRERQHLFKTCLFPIR